MACFTDASYQLTGDLQEVDHIGPQSTEKLNKQGIYTTYQLLGHFLWLDRDKTAFLALLKSADTPGAHREAVAEAVSKRVAEVGIKIGVTLPTHVDGTPVSSRLDEAKAKKIKNIKFNNDLRHDFPGVGFGNESETKTAKKLAAHGIENTNRLFGEMLRHFDQTQPTPDNLSKFWKRLGELGCADGWKTTIINAMIAKLDIGIDNYETEEPRTGPRPPTKSRLEEQRALHAYEAFFDLPHGSTTLDQVQAGIASFSTAEFSDWARRFHDDATAQLQRKAEAEAEAEALKAEVRKGRRLTVLVSLTFALLAYVTLAAAEQLPGWFATASIPPELSAPAITLVVVLHVALLIGGATWALRLRLGPSPGLL